MAHALTLAIEQQRPDAIVVVGIGGAYPGSALTIGDVVCAASETFGDLGVEAPEGFVELTEFPGVKPARYRGRYGWITIVNVAAFPGDYLRTLVNASYTRARSPGITVEQ